MNQTSNIKKSIQLVFGIRQNYMRLNQYESVAQKSFLRNVAFRTFCQQLEKFYLNYKKAADGLYQTVRHKSKTNKTYVRNLNRFLEDFSVILRDLSTFQIDSYTQLSKDSEDLPKFMTGVMVNKITEFRQEYFNSSKDQKQFKLIEQKLENTRDQLKSFSHELKKDSCFAYVYYDQNYMQEKFSQFSKYEQALRNYDSQIQKTLQKIKINSNQFGKFLLAYKKKLLQFKQRNLQKTIDTSKVSRQCLSELLVYLSQCVFVNYNKHFGLQMDRSFPSKIIENWDKQFSISSVEMANNKQSDQFKLSIKQDLQKEIMSLRQQYFVTIDDLCDTFKCLISSFGIMKESINKQFEQSKQELFKSFNQLYDSTDNPNNHVMQTIETFHHFNLKMVQLVKRFQRSLHQLMKLREDAKKHVEITLSILKANLRGTDRYLVNRYSTQKMHLQKLEDQLSADHIRNIVNSVFQSFKDTFTQLKNFFRQKFYRKKKLDLEDSMDLSYVQESVLKIDKGPPKNQKWLWQGNWRDYDSYRYSDAIHIIDNLTDFFDKVNLNTQCGKYIQKYQCMLQSYEKKDIKGQLQITEKQFIFINIGVNAGEIKVVIPVNQVLDQVQIKSKFVEQYIIMKTKRGKIYFKRFNSIQEAKTSINNRIAEVGGGQQEQVVQKRQKVQLSLEQLDYIAQRKKRIQPEIPKSQDLRLFQEFQVENIGIDQAYQQVFSDQQVKIQGKDYQSFMQYAFQKQKYFQYSTEKYNTPGPKFYTLNQAVTFKNCSTYSVRNTSYKMLLPPIPFVPKQGSVSQEAKIFWISHQQLCYSLKNQTSGAPSSDTFYVSMMYRIYQTEQKKIKIRMYGDIIFVKSTSLQSIIKSKSLDEMKIGLKTTRQIIQKRLKSYMRKRDGAKGVEGQVNKQEQQQEIDLPKKSAGDDLSKLKQQNKIMMYVIVGIILFNIILKILGY